MAQSYLGARGLRFGFNISIYVQAIHQKLNSRAIYVEGVLRYTLKPALLSVLSSKHLLRQVLSNFKV